MSNINIKTWSFSMDYSKIFELSAYGVAGLAGLGYGIKKFWNKDKTNYNKKKILLFVFYFKFYNVMPCLLDMLNIQNHWLLLQTNLIIILMVYLVYLNIHSCMP